MVFAEPHTIVSMKHNSVSPVTMVLWIGIVFLIISFCILMYVIVCLISRQTLASWALPLLIVWFCCGCVLVGFGILGEHIRKEIQNTDMMSGKQTGI